MASGNTTVSFSDIRTEWNRTGAISMSEMYRGGTYIKAKASDNLGNNLAANVPTSGEVSFDDFKGTERGFNYTFTATATDQSVATLFGDDYDLDYPKNVVINSGVELGATSTTEEALEVPSGGAGTITITNNGTLSGAGGAAGADGGDAFEAASTCTLINNGTIRAGGGGGGSGGSGQYQSGTVSLGQGNSVNWSNNCTSSCVARHGSGAYCNHGCNSPGCDCPGYYAQCNQCVRPNYVSTSGGAGGAGQGYNQSAGSGSSGGTNAGSGGAGASYGSDGTDGGNGNVGNGASAGSAGAYLRGSSFVTLTQSGTVQGNSV